MKIMFGVMLVSISILNEAEKDWKVKAQIGVQTYPDDKLSQKAFKNKLGIKGVCTSLKVNRNGKIVEHYDITDLKKRELKSKRLLHNFKALIQQFRFAHQAKNRIIPVCYHLKKTEKKKNNEKLN